MSNRLSRCTVAVALFTLLAAAGVPQAAQAPSRPQQPWPGVTPAGSPNSRAWVRPVRLPPTLPWLSSAPPYQGIGPAPGQPADGTWREDGRYIIINLNGQQVRLVKESQTPSAQGSPHRAEATGGTVDGRLLNRGRPLANCRVVIRPMTKTFGGYKFNPAVQPIRATTDVQGVYRFENVPPGPYKLSWLPQGTDQWIRRVAVRPDLTVRAHQTTQVKAIPKALRTLN